MRGVPACPTLEAVSLCKRIERLLLTERTAIRLFGPEAIHAGAPGLRVAVDDIHDALHKNSAPLNAAVALLVCRDHHAALLTIRRTALAVGLGLTWTVAPINITDGLLDKEYLIVPVLIFHDGIVACVETSCSNVSEHTIR